MKCTLARERFELASRWLKKVKNVYHVPENEIESFTEYFIIICRSISDYVIMDFLGTLEPKMSLGDRAEIVRLKKKYLKGEKINHKESEKINEFLKTHSSELIIFENQLLVRYFIALRNWSVHSIMPTIFTNEYEKEMKVKKRRFEKDFVFPISLGNGDRLVLEDGSGYLITEDSGEDSLFDKYPLNELSKEERKDLEKLLDTTEALTLLEKFFEETENFIKFFEQR
jgi:hypothetical protein